MHITKAFVTGGAGFIGSHVVDTLVGRGAKVVVYDNLVTGRKEFLPDTEKVVLVQGDVLDLPRLQSAMAGCDFVFHLQANADVRGGKEKPRVDLEQNTIATWNVLEAMRLNSVKGLAFASSAAVYGEPNVFPTPETYAPSQTSLYGASKLAGEAMIEAYCEYYGMRSFVFRFVSWIGEHYSHGVVFDFMKKLRTDSSRLPVLGNGQQKKSYLYVKDGISGIMLAIDQARAAKNVFNLGHDYFITVIDVATTVLDELKAGHVKLDFSGGERGWIGDSPLVHLDTTKIRNLGWKPQTSIEEGLRRTVRFLQANPHLLTTRQ